MRFWDSHSAKWPPPPTVHECVCAVHTYAPCDTSCLTAEYVFPFLRTKGSLSVWRHTTERLAVVLYHKKHDVTINNLKTYILKFNFGWWPLKVLWPFVPTWIGQSNQIQIFFVVVVVRNLLAWSKYRWIWLFLKLKWKLKGVACSEHWAFSSASFTYCKNSFLVYR